MRIFIFLLFICPSAFAAYTTMTLEGVKQVNGVWTAAGVMDTQGFVRTTGSVSVLGSTRNLPVAFAADAAASTSLLRVAARAAGPVALAAAAYDVYTWYTSDGIQSSGDSWSTGETLYYDGYCNYYSGFQPIQLSGLYTHDDCLSSIKSKATYLPVSRTDPPSNGYIHSYGTPSNYRAGSFWAYKSKPKPIPTGRDLSLPIPSFSVISSGFKNLPSLNNTPIPITGISFAPYSEWVDSPYFKDGNWFRDRMDISPCPTSGQPNRVCVDIGPQKFEGSTDPQTVPSQATGTATGSTPKEQPDFCKKNPQSIACAELGTLEPEPFNPIEKPFQITPQSPWGSGDAQCPAPKVINLHAGGSATMSYQPACDFFRGVRPVIIALAFIAALYIALGIPVGKGD